MTDQEYTDLVKGVSEFGRFREQAVGGRDELRKRLMTEFNCKNLNEAVAKIEAIKKEVREIDPKLNAEIAKLKKDYPDLFTT